MIRKLKLEATKRGWIVRANGRRAGEVRLKRGRRRYGYFIGALSWREGLIVEKYDYKTRRGATRADRASVMGFCYHLNRQAFLDLRTA
jgi:hypothetical protein